jgi:glyoxylase-like metal-dependent hydrolase (beta-lactamase superfamily II)
VALDRRVALLLAMTARPGRRETVMKTLKVGEITITSLIERDGPWRKPEAMFPAYDPEVGPRHTILIDTCTGNDKGYPAPYDFPKQPWLDNFRAAGLRLEDITHVFCTHLHFDHTGWNTMLRNGRWTPTFPNAKYIFHKSEYERWEAITARGELPAGLMAGNLPGNSWSYNCRPIVEAGQALLVDDAFQLDDNFTLVPTPGHSPCHCCVMIRSQGQEAVVTGDLMHHALQCREPDWSTIFDTDPVQAALSRRRLLGQVADTGTFVLPIHFPNPTTGLVSADGDRFRYVFVR